VLSVAAAGYFVMNYEDNSGQDHIFSGVSFLFAFTRTNTHTHTNTFYAPQRGSECSTPFSPLFPANICRTHKYLPDGHIKLRRMHFSFSSLPPRLLHAPPLHYTPCLPRAVCTWNSPFSVGDSAIHACAYVYVSLTLSLSPPLLSRCIYIYIVR